MHLVALACDSVQKSRMETKGIEQSSLKAPKTLISKRGGAKSGAPKDKNDSDLAEIIAVWLELPGHIKAAIKALIQTHKAEKT